MSFTNLQRSMMVGCAGLLAWAIFDVFVWNTNATRIQAGEAFVYWSHVGNYGRAWFALVGLLFAALWIFLRPLSPILRAFSPLAFGLLLAAWALFTLVAPLTTLTAPAHHLQSVRVDASVHHLFAQFEGFGQSQCETILVSCGTLGLQCRYRTHFPDAPRCLYPYTTTRLVNASGTLIVEQSGETIDRLRSNP